MSKLGEKIWEISRYFIGNYSPNIIKRISYELKSIICQYPLYVFIEKTIHGCSEVGGKELVGSSVVTRRSVCYNSEIVIEGYNRTANTFAVCAFLFSQGRPVRIGFRTHSPAQVIYAIKRGIPALVLIRDPADTIISGIIFAQHRGEMEVSMKQATRAYIRFYRKILPWRDHLIIGNFDLVTNDFGKLISELNHRYNKKFNLFEANEKNTTICKEIIKEGYKDYYGDDISLVVSSPVMKREEIKKDLKNAFWGNDMKKVRENAFDIYNKFL
jgi:hypothetical protein